MHAILPSSHQQHHKTEYKAPTTLSEFISSHPPSSTTSSDTSLSSLTPKPPSTTKHQQQRAIKMPFARRSNRATVTKTTKPTLMTRLRGRNANSRTVKTTTTRHPAGTTTAARRNHHTTHHHTTAAPVHHQRRKTSIGDKISGAMMKLKGSLTHRPGVKV